MPGAASPHRSLTGLLRRLVRGRGTLFTIFAGTSKLRELRPVMAALMGLCPLDEERVIANYEKAFARAAGVRHAFSFASGRMALYVLLEALGIGPGDEVIVPAFTCVVVPNAILYRGARPVYVDIDPGTFNIDVSQVEARISSRTRAIIAQHTFGLICDIDGITQLAARYKLAVLEDCAHSLGATHRGRACGSLGTAAFFSTDHTKVINTGTGGMLTTDDDALAGRIASIYHRTPFPPAVRIRTLLAAFVVEVLLLHPRVAAVGRYLCGLFWRLTLDCAYFLDELRVSKPTTYPYPARLSSPQAKIGLTQLSDLSANLAWRRHAAAAYEAEMGACAGLLEAGAQNHAFLRYTFLVANRQAWEAHFHEVLDMGVWYTSVAAGRDRDLHEIRYQPGSCPRAEMVARHCVNLPTHPRVNRPERLVERLRSARRTNAVELRLLGAPIAESARP